MKKPEERDYQLEIGRFVYLFSQAEFSLKVRVSAMFGASSHDALIMADSVDLYRFTEVAARLVNERQEADGWNAARKKGFSEAIKEFRSLNDERIRVVHGLWATTLPLGMVLQKSSRGDSFKLVDHYENIDTLRALADRAGDLVMKIISI
jgi:hypothetical protein